MEKDFQQLSEVDKQKLRDFWNNVLKFQYFSNNSKQNTFQYIFGEKEGKRLWEHFVLDCERDLTKFHTHYLSGDQHGQLLTNLFYEESSKLFSC